MNIKQVEATANRLANDILSSTGDQAERLTIACGIAVLLWDRMNLDIPIEAFSRRFAQGIVAAHSDHGLIIPGGLQ